MGQWLERLGQPILIGTTAVQARADERAGPLPPARSLRAIAGRVERSRRPDPARNRRVEGRDGGAVADLTTNHHAIGQTLLGVRPTRRPPCNRRNRPTLRIS
jgi:hypothetical protein